MDDARRRGSGLAFLILGALAVLAGTYLAVTGCLDMFQVAVNAMFARAPLFGVSYAWVPSSAFVWPTVKLIGGLSIDLLGWITLIRGLATAWPRRFDRS